jgi:hypothetical protein
MPMLSSDVYVEGRPWATNPKLQGRPHLPDIRLPNTRRPCIDNGVAEENIGEREHSQIHNIHNLERSDGRLSWRDRAFCRDLLGRIYRKRRPCEQNPFLIGVFAAGATGPEARSTIRDRSCIVTRDFAPVFRRD